MKLRRVIFVPLYMLAGVFVLLAGLLLFVLTSRTALVLTLNLLLAPYGVSVEVGGLDHALSTSILSLEAVEVTVRGERFGSIDRLSLRYRPSRLVEGVVAIEEAEVVSPDIFIQRSLDGSFNLPGPAGKTAPKAAPAGQGGFVVEIACFRIVSGRAEYVDEPAGRAVSLSDLGGEVDFRSRPMAGALFVDHALLAHHRGAPARLTLRADLEDTILEVESLRIEPEPEPGALEASGALRFEDGSHRLVLVIDALDPDTILSDLGVPDTQVGVATGEVRAAGSGYDETRFTVALEAGARGIPVAVDLAGVYREGTLSVSHGEVSGEEAEVTVTGWVEAATGALSVEARGGASAPDRTLAALGLRGVELRALTVEASMERRDGALRGGGALAVASVGVKGTALDDIALTLSLEGEPRLHVAGTIGGLRYGATRFGGGTLSAGLEGDTLEARLALPGLISADGRYVRGEETVDLAVDGDMDAAMVGSIVSAFTDRLSVDRGRAVLKARVTGSLDRPRVEGALDLTDVGWAAGPAAGALDGTVRLSGPLRRAAGNARLDLTRLVLDGTELGGVHLEGGSDGETVTFDCAGTGGSFETFTLRGTTDMEGCYTAGLEGVLDDIGPLAERIGRSLKGSVEIRGTGTGTFARPAFDVTLRTGTVELEALDLGAGTHRLSMEGDVLRFASAFERFGSLTGRLVTTADRTFSLEADLCRLPLDLLHALFGIEGFSGEVCVAASLSGDPGDRRSVAGTVEIPSLGAAYRGVPVAADGPIRARIRGGAVEIAPSVLRLEGGVIRVAGSLGEAFALDVGAELALKPLLPASRAVASAEGAILVDAQLRGSPGDPRIFGRCDLSASFLRLREYPFPLDDLRAEVLFDGEQVTLAKLSAGIDKEGGIEGRGAYRLREKRFSGVELTLHSVPYKVPRTIKVILDGHLRFEGGTEYSRLSGVLKIPELHYTREIEVVRGIMRPKRIASAKETSRSPFLRNLELDVDLETGAYCVVSNNLAKLTLGTDLKLVGRGARPVPIGEVWVTSGKLTYLKREFSVREATLDFSDRTKINPTVRLQALAEVKGESTDYTIDLLLEGPLDRLKVKLSSQPELEEPDILFLLATGKTQEEYLNSSSAPDISMRNAALSGASYLLGGHVAGALGLDYFEVGGEAEGGTGVTTRFGKEYGDRLEVRNAITLGPEGNVGRVEVGYKLTDNVYLVGTQGTDGAFGLDLRFRVRMR